MAQIGDIRAGGIMRLAGLGKNAKIWKNAENAEDAENCEKCGIFLCKTKQRVFRRGISLYGYAEGLPSEKIGGSDPTPFPGAKMLPGKYHKTGGV